MITRRCLNSDSDSSSGNPVIVVHGFAGKRIWMWPLCARLRSRGFRVHNFGYLSVAGSIETHAERLAGFLRTFTGEQRVHIVAHSMGTALVRTAFAGQQIDNAGRAVFIAPPGTGSPVVKFAAPVLGSVCKPVAELSSGENSFVNRLPDASAYELGVLAARFDILIPVERTHIDGEADHRALNGTHNSLLLSSKAAGFVATDLYGLRCRLKRVAFGHCKIHSFSLKLFLECLTVLFDFRVHGILLNGLSIFRRSPPVLG